MRNGKVIAALQAACLVMTGGTARLPAEPLTVQAADRYDSGVFNGLIYEDYGTKCRINGFTSELPADLVIPAKIEGMKVEWIGEGAFKGCTGLKSVTIPDTVRSIITDSFRDCTALESVTFPESTERVLISGNPFAGTPWFAAQKAKDPLVIAYRSVIDGTGCSGEVTVPDQVDEITEGAFAGNNAMTSVKMPETLVSIGREAFRACTALETVTVPGGLERIESKAFQGCSSLRALTVGEGVQTIESYAFEDCAKLKTVSFPQSLREIKVYAFAKCAALESVTLPERVKIVGAGAFTDCTALKQLTCLNYYTVLTGRKPHADVSYDNGISVSNSGEYSKKFTYSGVVRSYSGASPERYAKELGIRYESLGDPPLTGKCAAEMFWAMDQDTLYIEGTGRMDSYFGYDSSYGDDRAECYMNVPPWFMFRDRIKQIVVGAYVTQIASAGFAEMPVLERISFMNPDCLIPSGKYTVCNGLDDEKKCYYQGVIAGYSGSTAKKYAENSGWLFEALDAGTAVTTAAGTGTQPVTTAAASGTTATTAVPAVTTAPVTTGETGQKGQTGDVTGDGLVSIDDAQTVLKDYTEGVAGKASKFTAQQKKAADIDGNGQVSVEDAQWILKYYTEKNVAGKNITWADILK